jgi:hypothetical protein
MFEYILDAFDAGTPTAHHTQENVIREIGADLAFAHVVVQLGEGQWHFYEKSIRVDFFELGEGSVRLAVYDDVEESGNLFELNFLYLQLFERLISIAGEEVLLHLQLEGSLQVL